MTLLVLLMVVSPIALLVVAVAATPRVRRSVLQSWYGQAHASAQEAHPASQHKRYDRGFVVLLVAGMLLVLVMPIAYLMLLWLISSYGGGHSH